MSKRARGHESPHIVRLEEFFDDLLRARLMQSAANLALEARRLDAQTMKKRPSYLRLAWRRDR